MKKIISILIFNFTFLIFNSITAQNLVPNPSFEEYSECPNGYNQLNKSKDWTIRINTPDYFNKCSNNEQSSIPNNLLGFQLTSSENCSAYAGFFAYIDYSPGSIEFIGTELKTPLIIGQKYFVSFQVSLAYDNWSINCGVNKLGILFTSKFYGDTIMIPPPFINIQPQIYTDSIIVDTLNWITVFSSFIADSSYKYLIIGRFLDTNQVNTDCINTNLKQSYYFIDNICVSTDSALCNQLDISCLSGIKEEINTSDLIKIYPNPANGYLKIENKCFKIKKCSINDLYGNVIKKVNINDYQYKININDLSNGIYILKIINNKNQNFIKKFVKL